LQAIATTTNSSPQSLNSGMKLIFFLNTSVRLKPFGDACWYCQASEPGDS
jgi:hypothetical protein